MGTGTYGSFGGQGSGSRVNWALLGLGIRGEGLGFMVWLEVPMQESWTMTVSQLKACTGYPGTWMPVAGRATAWILSHHKGQPREK